MHNSHSSNLQTCISHVIKTYQSEFYDEIASNHGQPSCVHGRLITIPSLTNKWSLRHRYWFGQLSDMCIPSRNRFCTICISQGNPVITKAIMESKGIIIIMFQAFPMLHTHNLLSQVFYTLLAVFPSSISAAHDYAHSTYVYINIVKKIHPQ